jgi:hypothetical protein
MYEHLLWFSDARGSSVVALPFELEELIAGWASLRSAMRKTVPDAFSRDEWAYLLNFLSPDQLRRPYHEAFGAPAPSGGKARSLARPRGTVAVWLPNNVSLLGPLTLILLTITGNRILLKGGSRGDDLTGALLNFALAHLTDGALRCVLERQVRYEVFEHGDTRRQASMVEEADVRVVFGSDAAAAAIHGSANPLKGRGFSFVDRQSQVWMEPDAVSDQILRNLIQVFAIYGQAGCTSPRRVVMLNGSSRDAVELRDRLVALWPEVLRLKPSMHVASSNTLALQWAAACGWDPAAASNRAAVVGAGPIMLDPIDSPLFLPVSSASLEEAIEGLPANIQTLGHAFVEPSDVRWLQIAANTNVKRLVPIARMHHFGPLWDGEHFWRQCFEEIEVDL